MCDLSLLHFHFLPNFATHSGQYDARARVLIRHMSCLLRVCPQQLEEFEETLVEKLGEGGEESEWVTQRTNKCVWWQTLVNCSYRSVHCEFYAKNNTITVFCLENDTNRLANDQHHVPFFIFNSDSITFFGLVHLRLVNILQLVKVTSVALHLP